MNPKDYDVFVSYAREDDHGGWISSFVHKLAEEHRVHSGQESLSYFFDKNEIGSIGRLEAPHS